MRTKYICLNCKIGAKGDVAVCGRCGHVTQIVNPSLRIPKHRNKKAWNKLKQFYADHRRYIFFEFYSDTTGDEKKIGKMQEAERFLKKHPKK